MKLRPQFRRGNRIIGTQKGTNHVPGARPDHDSRTGRGTEPRHAIVVQNGNAYDEGLDNDFWKPIKAYWKEPTSKEKRDALRPFLKLDGTKWQYTHGVKNPELLSPDAWVTDQYLLDTGHFALETNGDEIARLTRDFLDKHTRRRRSP